MYVCVKSPERYVETADTHNPQRSYNIIYIISHPAASTQYLCWQTPPAIGSSSRTPNTVMSESGSSEFYRALERKPDPTWYFGTPVVDENNDLLTSMDGNLTLTLVNSYCCTRASSSKRKQHWQAQKNAPSLKYRSGV